MGRREARLNDNEWLTAIQWIPCKLLDASSQLEEMDGFTTPHVSFSVSSPNNDSFPSFMIKGSPGCIDTFD